MTTTSSKHRPLSKLDARLQTLSEQCNDLLERDRRDSEKHCLRSHSQRIWERLEPHERDTIREAIDDPFRGKDVPDFYVDHLCIHEIADHLKGKNEN